MAKNCGTCAFIEKNNAREHSYFGEQWYDFHCKECGGYHKEDETACRYYQERLEPSNTGCFITTVVVNILGYDDNCYILQTLRNFRNNFLQKNPEYLNLLLTYDSAGPRISDNLLQSEEKVRISEVVSEYYLIPICVSIENGDFYTAIDSYIKMVRFLQNQVCVVDYLSGYSYDPSVRPEEMGHGRARVLRVVQP